MNRLRDLLDAEHALASDEAAWRDAAEELGKEGRYSREALASDQGTRIEAVRAWLDALRKQGSGSEVHEVPALPGEAMVHGYRMMGAVSLGVGLLVGIVTTQGALWTTSGTPINVWQFLGLMVFLQIGLLLFSLGVGLWAKAQGQAWIGGLGRLLQGFHRWAWSRNPGKGASSLSEHGRADALRETSRVERWIWLGFTQRFAIAFNFGAVITFGARLFFSEMQFGWSATPDAFDPTLLQDVVAILGAPWAWAMPTEWMPSDSFVAATRWDVLSESFAEEGVGGNGWWRFLWMTLIVWGLLPRLLLGAYTSFARRRALQQMPWNHRGYQRLFALMCPVATSPSGQSTPAPAQPAVAAAAVDPGNKHLFLWGDWASRCDDSAWAEDAAPFAFLQASEQRRILAGHGAPEVDQAALQVLEDAGPTSEVWLLVEAGEAPDRRLTRFVQEIRRVMGAEVPLQVLPLEFRTDGSWPTPSSRDLEIWQRTLAKLEDRHLHVYRPSEGSGA